MNKMLMVRVEYECFFNRLAWEICRREELEASRILDITHLGRLSFYDLLRIMSMLLKCSDRANPCTCL
jgi:hypothetical protein